MMVTVTTSSTSGAMSRETSMRALPCPDVASRTTSVNTTSSPGSVFSSPEMLRVWARVMSLARAEARPVLLLTAMGTVIKFTVPLSTSVMLALFAAPIPIVPPTSLSFTVKVKVLGKAGSQSLVGDSSLIVSVMVSFSVSASSGTTTENTSSLVPAAATATLPLKLEVGGRINANV